jgi:hypothetical protein
VLEKQSSRTSEILAGIHLIPKNNNAKMGLATVNADETKREGSPAPSNEGGSAVPSGFILKLFQMVNGAPDVVISVS